MATFKMVAAEEAATLRAVKPRSEVDYTPYKTALMALAGEQDKTPGVTQYGDVGLAANDNVKTERRRFVQAGKQMEPARVVKFHKSSTDKRLLPYFGVPRVKKS